MKRNYGWVPDKKDDRDLILTPVRLKAIPPVRKASIKASGHSIYDQGQFGTCTGQATVRAFCHAHFLETGRVLDFSRAVAYSNAQKIENVDCDPQAGAQIRDIIKGAVKYGIPLEQDYEYTDANLSHFPPDDVMVKAEKWQVLKYYRIPNGNIDLMKQAIAAGFSPVFGAMLYNSFQSDFALQTGIISMPGRLRIFDGFSGGHALCSEEFDDDLTAAEICDRQKVRAPKNLSKTPGYFTQANSWGVEVQDKGYNYMPYDYFTKRSLVKDIWVVSQTELGV